jgi:antitoxin HicB
MMNKRAEEYINEPYTRILIPNEDGSYSAEILEFSGCFAEGETANEAMDNLINAALAWLETCIEQGLDIPEPFENQDFGGKIALRLPRSLHRQASRMAERDGVSLNQFLVSAISARVGAENMFMHLMDKFEQTMGTVTTLYTTDMLLSGLNKSIRIQTVNPQNARILAGTSTVANTSNLAISGEHSNG